MSNQTQLVVRVSKELAAELDDLAKRLESKPTYAPSGKMTRSDVVRLLLLRGLEDMRAELE